MVVQQPNICIQHNQSEKVEPAQNYVDRVRVPDTSHAIGGPGRGSGWRQRSLSNIDLTSQGRQSFSKKNRDSNNSGLYDLYSRIESRREYESSSYKDKQKYTKIYDHIKPATVENLIGADSCSLRRTRSLAVIREETYNDLQITGVRTRRSQLIPRAKLINRTFFQNRTKSKNREDDSGSGVDTQTSETRESDDYYANLKKLDIEKSLLPPWLNDKSDLDSLDSDYFKNSSHQSNNGDVAESTTGQSKELSNTKSEIQVLDIEVHNQNHENSISNTTTISNSDYSEEYSITKNIGSDTLKNISSFDEIILSSEKDSDSSVLATCELSFNTLTLSHHKISESDIETFDKKGKFKENRKSVVSYDSIYLSSEGSIGPHEGEESFENGIGGPAIPEITVTSNGELVEVELINPEPQAVPENRLEELYSQIIKKPSKPKIISTEPKSNLTSFSDTSTRGTLERLTIVSTPAQQKGFHHIEGKLFSTESFVGSLIDNQYCSLPDASIGVSLRASECIDAKLRQSCTVIEELADANNNTIYDSISRFGKAHKRLRQRENFEIVVLNPISIDEQPKEAPSIEVEQSIKEVETIEVNSFTQHQKSQSIFEESKENHSSIKVYGKKTLIVDELAAKTQRNLEQFEKTSLQLKKDTENCQKEISSKIIEQKSTRTSKSNIQIIVTDSQENIVEKCVNECPKINISEIQEKVIGNSKKADKLLRPNFEELKGKIAEIKAKIETPTRKENQIGQIEQSQSPVTSCKTSEELREEFRATLTDTLRKRIAANRTNFAQPKVLRVASAENIEKLDDTFKINPTLTYKVKFKEQSEKMSRPQILNVIDSKRNSNVCSVAPTRQQQPTVTSTSVTSINRLNDNHNTDSILKKQNQKFSQSSTEINQEFLEKVDSIRGFWSKLHKEKQENTPVDEVDCNKIQNNNIGSVSSIEDNQNDVIVNKSYQNNNYLNGHHLTTCHSDNSDFSSFSPTVEIIELGGDKQATIVNAQHAGNGTEFDHIRYKVMRSETFQKNMLKHTRKEAQFDGLLQYLHNYSFQELLANNNVVIIEPIRTKIEQISGKPTENQTINCKITGGAGGKNVDPKSVVNRHFFYHPIRVNKELLDEELPTPDTVRNARKVFEETMRLRTGKPVIASESNNKLSNVANIKNNENLRIKAMRHLTIDTSYGSTTGIKKWDSSSMSSGVSSDELNSPCECNDYDQDNDQKEMYPSEENICNDEMFESHYVSQDVLEKIRECGSSVTYYGGRVVGINSADVSPMTKAIMQEIRGQTNVCGACQPYKCPQHTDKLFQKTVERDGNNLSVKFKLVKSNSCSSRLELAGTGQQLSPMETIEQSSLSPETDDRREPEESVRTIVNRLETGAIGQKTMPRIIESKCIEKTINLKKDTNSASSIQWNNSVLINNQSVLPEVSESQQQRPIDLITQVTVNNHINFSSPDFVASLQQQQKKHQQSTPITTKTTASVTASVTTPVTTTTTMTTTTNITPATKGETQSQQQHQQQQQRKNENLSQRKDKPVNAKSTTLTTLSSAVGNNQHVIVANGTTKYLPSTNEINSSKPMAVNYSNGVSVKVPPQSLADIKQCNDNGNNNNNNNNNSEKFICEPLAPRLVKWNTLNSFDEKNYVTNDAKLKQKPKFDDIEFEEFEVYDPSNECYDSLNSKKN